MYIDDILIHETEHLQILEEVFKRLAKAELKVKKHKCKFMVPYFGHVIDSKGLHPLPEKVEAIRQAPTPKNVTKLKSYLGLLTYLTYYGKFLPNLSTRLAPLYKLLSKKESWQWMSAQENAFNKSKELLTSSQLLVHFNSRLPLLLACDASAFGIGTVLAH